MASWATVVVIAVVAAVGVLVGFAVSAVVFRKHLEQLKTDLGVRPDPAGGGLDGPDRNVMEVGPFPARGTMKVGAVHGVDRDHPSQEWRTGRHAMDGDTRDLPAPSRRPRPWGPGESTQAISWPPKQGEDAA